MYESSPQQVARVVDYAAFFLMGELFEYGKGNELFQVLKDNVPLIT